MKKPTATLYLDELRPNKDGKCSVKIRVTFNRIRHYYKTSIYLTKAEFEKITTAKRRTPAETDINDSMNSYLTKATNILKGVEVFIKDDFDSKYYEKRNIIDSVSFAFDKYIQLLRSQKRIGTAVSYECAKNSLENYKKGLTFADVTPGFLNKYENWMIEQGNTVSTVGIYLRSLRAIFNIQKIDRGLYPFGKENDKYTIPTGNNVKKALTVDEIASIYRHHTVPKTTKDMAKDYWLFLYLSNGMNVKDFCLLKWENIDGDMLYYKRAKTKRSKKNAESISVALKPQTLEIIKKWGQPSITKDAYIFPHLQPGMKADRERAVYQQLTKTINKYMKQIVQEIGINKNVTTYFARHSFATVLKRSGAKIEMISELLGHSSVEVTKSYLDSFEKKQIKKQTNALTVGF